MTSFQKKKMQPLNKPQQKNCEKIVDSEIQDSVKKRQPVCILKPQILQLKPN